MMADLHSASIFVLLLCCLATLVGGQVPAQDETIKMAFITTRLSSIYGYDETAGAVTLAEMQARREGILKSNFSVKYGDDQCAFVPAQRIATSYKEGRVADVFLGPHCSESLEAVGRLSSRWDIPLITVGAEDSEFTDKKKFATLIRVGINHDKYAQGLSMLVQNYGWKRIILLTRSENNVFCDGISKAIMEEFYQQKITIAKRIGITGETQDLDPDSILDDIRDNGRVVLFCSPLSTDHHSILTRARERGMTSGEYVFIRTNPATPVNAEAPWVTGGSDEGNQAKEAFRAVLQYGPEQGEKEREFRAVDMKNATWYLGKIKKGGAEGSSKSPAVYDATYLYFLLLKKVTLKAKKLGSYLREEVGGLEFEGMTGTVKMDANGDRLPIFWVWSMNQLEDEFSVKMILHLPSGNESQVIETQGNIRWGEEGSSSTPVDAPVCGFHGEFCPEDQTTVLYIAVGVMAGVVMLLIVALIAVALCMRNRSYIKGLRESWEVKYTDINRSVQGLGFHNEQFRNDNKLDQALYGVPSQEGKSGSVYASQAAYKGNKVSIIKLHAQNKIEFNRGDYMWLRNMKGLIHENVNVFVGMSCRHPEYLLLYRHAQTRTLKEVVANTETKLDWKRQSSLLYDLANGLNYVHSSPLGVHGSLRSTTCVVDSYWTLKLSEAGVHRLVGMGCVRQGSTDRGIEGIWMAPEVQRSEVAASKSADVYAAGVIVYEVIFKRLPYSLDAAKADIDESLEPRRPGEQNRLRTPVQAEDRLDQSNKGVLQLAESCWDNNPSRRPSAEEMRSNMRDIMDTRSKSDEGMEKKLSVMERYARGTEMALKKQSVELDKSRRRSTKQSVNPWERQPFPVQDFGSATVCMTEIVGFGELLFLLTPGQMIDLLNDVEALLDNKLSGTDICRFDTLSGKRSAQIMFADLGGRRQTVEIVDAALALHEGAQYLPVQLDLRSAINTGPCTGGTVGTDNPRLLLYGTAPTVADAMLKKGTGPPIQLSESTFQALHLTSTGGYHFRQTDDKAVYGLDGKFRRRMEKMEKARVTELEDDHEGSLVVTFN